jgi:hypothetical protein
MGLTLSWMARLVLDDAQWRGVISCICELAESYEVLLKHIIKDDRSSLRFGHSPIDKRIQSRGLVCNGRGMNNNGFLTLTDEKGELIGKYSFAVVQKFSLTLEMEMVMRGNSSLLEQFIHVERKMWTRSCGRDDLVTLTKADSEGFSFEFSS